MTSFTRLHVYSTSEKALHTTREKARFETPQSKTCAVAPRALTMSMFSLICNYANHLGNKG